MQGAVGLILATLTLLLRDQSERPRYWTAGCGPERVEEEAHPRPPTPVPPKIEVSCESVVNPRVVEDIARRVNSEQCVCQLECNCSSRDTWLVVVTCLTVFVGQAFIYIVFWCLGFGRQPRYARTVPNGPSRAHGRSALSAGVIE